MSPQRILVVEDESLIRELLVEVLTDAGFEVDEAQDTEAAGDLIDADGYKLLLTDVHMPGPRDGSTSLNRRGSMSQACPFYS